MKKFTDIGKTGKVIKRSNTDTLMSSDLGRIIESSLKISIEGDLDDYLTKNIEIEGKEKLVKKLSKYIDDISHKNISNILEKVKYQGLDNVILEHQTPGEILKHRERIESLLKKDDPIKSANQQANSIKNGDKAYYRSIAAGQMVVDYPENKKILNEIKDIFFFKSKQLGYRRYG